MNIQYNFTYIIPYRHNVERLNNLRRVIDWVMSFSGSEIILVEQDTHSKISHLRLPCRHLFLKSKMPFNRSWSFNCGLKYANSNAVVFGDCDLIMPPDKFIESLMLLEKYDMVNPYSSVIDLDRNESNMQLDQLMNIGRPGRGENDSQKINPCGGICIFKKDSVNRIGGWHEDFVGWGAEDDFQFIKVKNFLKWAEVPGKCFHLYHERPAPDMKWYQRSMQLLNKLQVMSRDELEKVIANMHPKSGMKNKYETF